MDNILDFLSQHYIWFFIAAAVLLLALIGYIAQSKKKDNKKDKLEIAPESIPNTETTVADIPEQTVKETVVNNNQSDITINDIPVSNESQNVNAPEIETVVLEPTSAPTPVSEETIPIHDLNLNTPVVNNTTSDTPVILEMDDNSNNTNV